jgi:hypothetical protein
MRRIQASRGRLLPLLVAVALGAAPATSAQQPPAPAGPSPLSALVSEVTALFPTLEGDILEVRGSEATLGLGKRDGVQAGVELSLYRPGRELKHPRTGEVLGRTEEPVGRLRVVRVFEAYSTGTLTPVPGVTAVPGDRARISAGRIPVTVVKLVDRTSAALAEAAAHEVFDALNKSGRFRATWGDQIAAWLAGEGVSPLEFLRGTRVTDAAARFKTEYILALHFHTVEKKPFVDVRLFAPSQADPLLTTAFYVPASVRQAATDKARFSGGGDQRSGQVVVKQRSLLARLLSGEAEPTAYSSGEASIPLKEVAKFPFVVRAFDVSVAPRDGLARVAVTDGSKVYVYRLADERLEAEWTYSMRAFGTVISLQLADLDADGVLEVIVNRHHYSSQHSFGMVGLILGAADGKAQVLVDDIDSILLAVDDTGAGVRRTLWSQNYHREKFFEAGKVQRVEIRNGKVVATAPVRVPDDFRNMGAILSNVTGKGGTRTLAYVDIHRRLRIAAEREELWRSSTGVGGGGPKLEVSLPATVGVRSVFYDWEPMPVAVDLDNDGVDEIIIPQTVLQEGLLAVVYRGPAGYRLQSVNSGFEGPIIGLGAVPGERPTLVAAVTRPKGFLGTTGETQIIITLNPD